MSQIVGGEIWVFIQHARSLASQRGPSACLDR